MIIDFCDRAFFINMDSREDRLIEVMGELKDFNIDAERIIGVDGNPLEIDTNISPGQVGCALSHLECYKRAKENETLLILEDDVEFRVGANILFDKWVVDIPDDWDILFLGGNHRGETLRDKPQIKRISNGHIYKTQYTLTTHAYFIRGEVILWMMERIPEMEMEVDVLLAKAQRIYNAYTFIPNLAWQRKGFSSINNRECDYTFMKDEL